MKKKKKIDQLPPSLIPLIINRTDLLQVGLQGKGLEEEEVLEFKANLTTCLITFRNNYQHNQVLKGLQVLVMQRSRLLALRLQRQLLLQSQLMLSLLIFTPVHLLFLQLQQSICRHHNPFHRQEQLMHFT